MAMYYLTCTNKRERRRVPGIKASSPQSPANLERLAKALNARFPERTYKVEAFGDLHAANGRGKYEREIDS
jgi:hypothetical protein